MMTQASESRDDDEYPPDSEMRQQQEQQASLVSSSSSFPLYFHEAWQWFWNGRSTSSSSSERRRPRQFTMSQGAKKHSPKRKVRQAPLLGEYSSSVRDNRRQMPLSSEKVDTETVGRLLQLSSPLNLPHQDERTDRAGRQHFLSSSSSTAIRHFQQISTWDCGCACLQMVLHYWQPACRQIYNRNYILPTIATRSIWTMDLVQVLENARSGSRSETKFTYLLCSKTLHVDADHGNLNYYKNSFSEDEARINGLFQEAKAEGWPMLCTPHLPMKIVIDIVARPDCVAIALLDNSTLRHVTEKEDGVGRRPYAGHYVVVTGVVLEGTYVSALMIHNPAVRKGPERISIQHFEEAWRAQGTDDDIIFVAKPWV